MCRGLFRSHGRLFGQKCVAFVPPTLPSRGQTDALTFNRNPLIAPNSRLSLPYQVNSGEGFRKAHERIVGDVSRLFAHLLSTDPSLFIVAVDTSKDSKVIGIGNACFRKPNHMFICFVFVEPAYQGGVGRRMFNHLVSSRPNAETTISLTTDTAQPVSNALYAQFGIVGRIPLQNMRGTIDTTKLAQPFQRTLVALQIVRENPKEDQISLDDATNEFSALEKEVLGYSRNPSDHPYFLTGKPLAFLFRDASTGQTVGYSYAKPGGAIGPVLASRRELFRELVLDSLVKAQEAGRKQAEKPEEVVVSIWTCSSEVPELFAELMQVGMKISGFPMLLAWDGEAGKPFVSDWKRYQMNGPGFL